MTQRQKAPESHAQKYTATEQAHSPIGVVYSPGPRQARPTQAQVNAAAGAQEAVHVALGAVDSQHLLGALEAHLTARPDLTAEELEAFAQRLSRYAWRM